MEAQVPNLVPNLISSSSPNINVGGYWPSGNWPNTSGNTYVQPSIQFQDTTSNALYTSAVSALKR